MNVASTDPASRAETRAIRQTTVCDFCGSSSILDLEVEEPGRCPDCGATWHDRALLDILLSFECPPGAPTFRKLVEALQHGGKTIAAIGPLFDRPDTDLPGVIHRFTAEQLLGTGRRKPRLPIKAGTLDYLIVRHSQHMVVPLSDTTKALRPGGVLVITGGFVWPLPPKGEPVVTQTPEVASAPALGLDPIAEARKLGLAAWFERSGLGTHILQRECFLVIAAAGGVSAQR